MSKKILCPSMMCADYGNLADEVEKLDEAGTDIFHIDVMDGMFVPNFAMGIQDISFITSHTKKPVDAHLMIMNPGNYVDLFAGLGLDILYVHPEAEIHTTRTLQKIIDAGVKPGIAINPGTSFESVETMLSLCEYVMVMTVNPGFAGQNYLSYVDDKLLKFVDRKSKYGYKLMIDGACSPEKIKELSAVGVDGFVLGSSALFGKGRPYKEIIPELREL